MSVLFTFYIFSLCELLINYIIHSVLYIANVVGGIFFRKANQCLKIYYKVSMAMDVSVYVIR